ncbi:MAG: RNA ligase family protein [Promethearchaeota archaeon]
MRKYLEIENALRKKYIASFRAEFPDLETQDFIITEKIDGTNVRLGFKPDGTILLGSRKRILKTDEDHFGLKEIIKEPRYQQFLEYCKAKAKESGKEIMMVGELFGKGINNRIEYGPCQICFFDMFVDDCLVVPIEFYEFMADFPQLCVPTIEIIQGLTRALDLPVKFPSKIASGLAEGMVIKPYRKIIRQGFQIFYLKHKNPDFEDRPGAKHHQKDPSPLQDYISRNRVIDMFSKVGEITSKKQIGQYVKLIREDALMDFKKEHPDTEITTQQMHRVNGRISRLLLEFI